MKRLIERGKKNKMKFVCLIWQHDNQSKNTIWTYFCLYFLTNEPDIEFDKSRINLRILQQTSHLNCFLLFVIGKHLNLFVMPPNDTLITSNGRIPSNSFDENESMYHKNQFYEGYQSGSFTEENLDEDQIVRLPLSTYDSHELSFDFEKKDFSSKDFLHWIIGFSFVYFLWFIFIAGISMIHLIIYCLLLILVVISDRTRRLVFVALIYLTYVFLYDALHLIPNYTVSKIHIEDVYLIEKQYFGITVEGHRMTLNEYFQQHHIPFLDVFTGFCYLNW